MAIPMALLAASTALSAYGNYMQAKEAEKASLLEAQDAYLQAQETKYRAERNIEQRTKQGQKIIGQQQVGYAASGVDVNSGASMDMMMSTINTIMDENLKDMREADFAQYQLNKTAQAKIAAAGNYRTAGLLGVVGSGMSGATTYYKNS